MPRCNSKNESTNFVRTALFTRSKPMSLRIIFLIRSCQAHRMGSWNADGSPKRQHPTQARMTNLLWLLRVHPLPMFLPSLCFHVFASDFFWIFARACKSTLSFEIRKFALSQILPGSIDLGTAANMPMCCTKHCDWSETLKRLSIEGFHLNFSRVAAFLLLCCVGMCPLLASSASDEAFASRTFKASTALVSMRILITTSSRMSKGSKQKRTKIKKWRNIHIPKNTENHQKFWEWITFEIYENSSVWIISLCLAHFRSFLIFDRVWSFSNLKTFQTAHMFPILMEIKDMSEDWQVTRRSALSPGRNSPLFRGEWWTSVCPVQCRPHDFTKVLNIPKSRSDMHGHKNLTASSPQKNDWFFW